MLTTSQQIKSYLIEFIFRSPVFASFLLVLSSIYMLARNTNKESGKRLLHCSRSAFEHEGDIDGGRGSASLDGTIKGDERQ